MALLKLPGIGCSSSILARAGSRCLAAASHAPSSSSPVFLLHANGGGGGGQAHLLSRKATTGDAMRTGRRDLHVVVAAAAASAANVTPASPRGVSASDVLWPSAGAFLAMAVLGRIDQMMAFKGVSLTVAPLGAVCAVLFTAPDSPPAKKYNMFVAQIGCAAIGVLALSLFGPGWLARGAALSASIAFMTITGSSHPPAASLPLLFIDGPKFHHLQLWYALFPGAAGCAILCLIEIQKDILTIEETVYHLPSYLSLLAPIPLKGQAMIHECCSSQYHVITSLLPSIPLIAVFQWGTFSKAWVVPNNPIRVLPPYLEPTL
ncbi:hypothetical protein ACQJBY_067703 [Aegilops geniculata]